MMGSTMADNSKPAMVAPGAKRPKRITGVDAARGLALVGMISIHVLPMATGTGEPTITWQLAAGVSAALFSLLAGVSLALSTGGSNPIGGTALNGARIGTAVRAVLLIALGLLLALVNPPAGVILAYYGVMFLLAVPLLGAGAGTLFWCAAAFAVIGGPFVHYAGAQLPGLYGYDPSVVTLFTAPGATISALLVTGTYPALAWMAFICAGLAIGRLRLRTQDVQLRLIVGGLLTAVVSWVVSVVIRDFLGGFDRVLFRTPGLTEAELLRALTWGPGFSAPEITSGWWLLMLSPYSETPAELVNTAASAVFIAGAMLWIASKVAWLVTPLVLMGTMTLTLYSVHLLFLATPLLDDAPYVSFWVQLGAALLFVVLWRNVTERRQGPLEWVVARAADRARSRYLEHADGA